MEDSWITKYKPILVATSLIVITIAISLFSAWWIGVGLDGLEANGTPEQETWSQTFYLGDEIHEESFEFSGHKYFFHGFKDDYLVIGNYRWDRWGGWIAAMSNIYIKIDWSILTSTTKQFRLADRTFTIEGFPLDVRTSITLSWEE